MKKGEMHLCGKNVSGVVLHRSIRLDLRHSLFLQIQHIGTQQRKGNVLDALIN